MVGNVGAIHLLPAEGNSVLYVATTMLHPLQIKGFYGGKSNEDPYDHIRNFLDVCSQLIFKNVSQESIHLQLFPFSLSSDASKWLVKLLAESITSWDELRDAFIEKLFPLPPIKDTKAEG